MKKWQTKANSFLNDEVKRTKALMTAKQVTVCSLERSCDRLYLSLGVRLSANILDLFNYTPKSFQYITETSFLPLNTCIVTLWIAYWLFLLTTWTWTLNPIDNNYLSREKKKKKICVFSFHYKSACTWKNMYLSSFQHLAGAAKLLRFQNLADKLTFQ